MKPWKITWQGFTWTDEEVTGATAGIVSELVGDSWEAMDPWSSPRVFLGWMIALLASVSDQPGEAGLQAAMHVVYGTRLDTLMSCIEPRTPGTVDAVIPRRADGPPAPSPPPVKPKPPRSPKGQHATV